MKKFLILGTLLSILAASSYADGLKILSCGIGTPGIQEPQLMGLGISPNGKYICGPIENGTGIFVADRESGQVKYKLIGENCSELRGVDDNGLAIGYVDDDGALFSFDTGEESFIKAPEGYRYVLGEAVTNDGNLMVGSLTGKSFDTKAAYCNINNGDEWISLPYPSQEELGDLNGTLQEGSAAKRVSADGKVILGYLGSFTVPMMWVMNKNGEYETDFFPLRFLKLTEEDIANDERPLYSISAMYFSLSNNGRFAALLGLVKNKESGDYLSVPVIYNTETKSITIYDCPQPCDLNGSGLYPLAICDDGTFVGTIGQPGFYSEGSFIMKAGQTIAETYNDAFPAFEEKLGWSDELGYNFPTSISADGKYILGYTFYCEDYFDENQDAYYVTYVISTDMDNSVKNFESESLTGNEMIYSIDGRKLNRVSKGINIVRTPDGKVRKLLK